MNGETITRRITTTVNIDHDNNINYDGFHYFNSQNNMIYNNCNQNVNLSLIYARWRRINAQIIFSRKRF